MAPCTREQEQDARTGGVGCPGPSTHVTPSRPGPVRCSVARAARARRRATHPERRGCIDAPDGARAPAAAMHEVPSVRPQAVGTQAAFASVQREQRRGPRCSHARQGRAQRRRFRPPPPARRQPSAAPHTRAQTCLKAVSNRPETTDGQAKAQRDHNPRVGGSSPSSGMRSPCKEAPSTIRGHASPTTDARIWLPHVSWYVSR